MRSGSRTLGPPNHMSSTLRQARRGDIPAMHRVRLAVRENRLTSSAITEQHYLPAIEETGRGWVIEVSGTVVAFAVGNVDRQHLGAFR
jgi:hypothetical protein